MSNLSSRGKDWEALAKQVLQRDNYICQYQMAGCTRDTNLSVDHIVAKANGGMDEEHNLITACRSCNGKKGARNLTRTKGRKERFFV